MRALALVILVILCSLVPVYAKEGFSFRWSYGVAKDFTSLAAMDLDREGYPDSIMAGSLDNKVYVFDDTGGLRGSYEAESTVTSVASFVHDGDNKLNDGLAGSLDNNVYAFWPPNGREYFRIDSHWWNYSTGDNVYALGTFELNQSGQFDGIVVGIGNYADEEYGKIMAFSYDGTSLWNFSVSSKVTVFSVADLGSDNAMSDILAGSGKSVHVLDSSGSVIWSYEFDDYVTAISYADFDKDGQNDDILVGAGNTTYAIDSHRNLLWKYEFENPVASVSPVDRDGDGVIDYYLVSAGTVFYALSNQPSEGAVSWEYDVGTEIRAHISLDFDNDGTRDDVAFISNNYLFAYDFDYLFLPAIKLSKTASSQDVSVGDRVTITLYFENLGNGVANALEFNDQVPAGFKLVAGELSGGGIKMPAWGDKKVYYTLEAVEGGSYELPAASAFFMDNYGNSYDIRSNELKINVAEAKVEAADISRSEGAPVLDITRSFSRENLSAGDNLTVTVELKNLGSKPALAVSFEEALPPGVVLIEGEASWKGAIEPGESKVFSHVLEVRKVEDGIKELPFMELAAYYRDDSGKVFQAVAEARTLGLASGGRDLKSAVPVLLLASAVGAAVLLRRKLHGGKPVDPMLEEKFIQVYLNYQKKGERPTYEVMERELGVSTNEVDRIAGQVQKKMRTSSASPLLAKLKDSIPLLRR